MDADIFTLQKERINEFWPSVLPFLLKCEAPDWTPDQVKDDLLTAKAQLWGLCNHDGIMGIWITRIEMGAVKYGCIWITAGTGLDEGLPQYREHIEQWFFDSGCEYIEFTGRKGWGRALPDYEQVAVVFRKRLQHEKQQSACEYHHDAESP